MPFRPFNYGQAVSQGQTIAANALNLRQGVRAEQGSAAVNALAQRGVTGQQKYNMLSQSGFGDVAQTERAADMKRDVAKTEWLKSQASQVYNQATYDAMAQRVDGTFGKPGSTYEKFGKTYESDVDGMPGAKLGLDRLVGRGVAKYDTKKHFSGQEIFKDESGRLFMGTGVGDPRYGTVTPSMVAVDGSGAKAKGKLHLVNMLGQTSGEVVSHEASKLTAKALAKDDATFYTDYIQETRNMESSIGELEMTQGLLDELASQADYSTTGFGKYLNKIPLTDATHWAELKSTVQSRIAMGKMLELKESSATGSTGFGQLSEKELKVLMDHLGSLEQAQSPKEIKKVVGQIYKSMEGVKKGYRNQMLQNRKRFKTLHKEYYGKSRELPLLKEDVPEQQLTTPQTEEEYNALKSGAEYIDPDDGKTYRKP